MVAARSSRGHGSKRCFATKVEMHSGSAFLSKVVNDLQTADGHRDACLAAWPDWGQQSWGR
eukprot:12949207-Heterocapsa_arctica.AAC.1